MADWKETLYENTRELARREDPQSLVSAWRAFTYLGDYRDSQAQACQCKKWLEADWDEVTKELGRVRTLSGLFRVRGHAARYQGWEGCGQVLEEMEIRKQALYERTIKRRRRLHILFILILIFVFSVTMCLPRLMRERQDSLYRRLLYFEGTGEYDQALKTARKLMSGSHWHSAQISLTHFRAKVADQLLEEGRLEEALAMYEEAENEEGIRAVWRAKGDAFLLEKEYWRAMEAYENAADQEGMDAVGFAWGEALRDVGDYQRSLEVLRSVSENPKRDEMIQSVYAACRDTSIDRLYQQEEKDPLAARELGEPLDDVDSQLAFCTVLKELGYDLEQVYPDGVIVEDVSLAVYQPTAENQSLMTEEAGKVLVFRRKEQTMDRLLSIYRTVTSSEAAQQLIERKEKDASYEVRLLPGALFQLPDEMRAASMDSCDTILLMDTIYLARTTTRVHDRPKTVGNINGGTFYGNVKEYYYPVADAIDTVALYQKETPNRFYLFGYQGNQSGYAEELDSLEEMGLSTLLYSQSNEINNEEDYRYYWGSSDPEFLKQLLEEGVAHLAKAGS